MRSADNILFPKTYSHFRKSSFFIVESMNIQKSLLTILCLVFIAHATVFVASVSQDSMSVGDRILFNAVMIVPKGASVTPPPTENGFGKFSIKEWNSDKVEKKNADSLSFNYVLTMYTPEPCTLPPVPFVQVMGEKGTRFFPRQCRYARLSLKAPIPRLRQLPASNPNSRRALPRWLGFGLLRGPARLRRLRCI